MSRLKVLATAKLDCIRIFYRSIMFIQMVIFAYIVSKVIAMQCAVGIIISGEPNCPNRKENFEKFTFDHCKLYFYGNNCLSCLCFKHCITYRFSKWLSSEIFRFSVFGVESFGFNRKFTVYLELAMHFSINNS